MSQAAYRLIKASNKFTRPANTNAYVSGQVVSNGGFIIIPFPDRAAYLRRLLVSCDNLSTAINLRLHLFNSDPTGIVTTIADQSTLVLPAACFNFYEGFIDTTLTLNGGLGSGSPTSINNLVLPADPDGVLFGLCSVFTAFTPGNAATFRFDFYYETCN